MDGLLIGGSESEDRIKGRFLNSPSNQSVPGLIAIMLYYICWLQTNWSEFYLLL